jgi:hypothetical protein
MRVFSVVTHTEHSGTGRVKAFQLFGGAGRCIYLRRGRGLDGKPLDAPGWRPTIALVGVTLYVRTAPTSGHSTWGVGFGRVAVARSGNRYNLFKEKSS